MLSVRVSGWMRKKMLPLEKGISLPPLSGCQKLLPTHSLYVSSLLSLSLFQYTNFAVVESADPLPPPHLLDEALSWGVGGRKRGPGKREDREREEGSPSLFLSYLATSIECEQVR